jgi:hypothetical protein
MADFLLNIGCIDVPVQKTDGALFETYLNSPLVEDDGTIIGQTRK